MVSSSSSSSVKAFSAVLFRVFNGVSLKPNTDITLQSKVLLSRKLSSCSWHTSTSSFSGKGVSSIQLKNGFSPRKISTFFPLCMGRRSCKIADRKGAQNAKKSKLHSRFGKQIVSAVKRGGPNPIVNTALAALIEKGKELDVPKDILERNVKRASDKGQEAFTEKFYEVHGYGGVGIVVEVLTDNVHRTAQMVRCIVRDNGGKLADSGSVMFKFRRARVATVKVTDVDRDQLLTIALDAGADDVIEPSLDEDDTEEDSSERYFKVVSSTENYTAIISKLREEGITYEPDKGYELIPIAPVEVDDEAMDLNKELVSKLLELDDVDSVYTDQK